MIFLKRESLNFPPFSFGNLEPAVPLEFGLLSPNMQGRSFSVTLLDRTIVNMTPCSETEEEMDEEDGLENC